MGSIGQVLAFVMVLLVLANAKKSASKVPKGTGSGGDKASKEESAAQRVSTIAAKTPYTFLSDKNFTTFVANRPRNYHAILMFTALDPRYQCAVCGRARNVFVEAAKFYDDQYDFQGESTKKRLAFFIVDVDLGRNTFNDMGLETVPRTFALPPLDADAPKIKVGDFEVNSQSLLDGAPAFLEQISGATSVSVVPTKDPWQYILITCLVAYLLAYFASAASFNPSEAVFWYRSPRIWVFASMVCFIVGVSGSIFCVIRSAPLVGRYQGRGMTIFAGQGRDQFLLEGLIIGLLTVGCGVAGVLMVAASKIKSPEPLTRHVGVILGLAMFIVFGMEIADYYKMKTGWYQVKETIPPEMWAWMSGSVKKSSGLFKRLFRLSEVYINEYSTFTGFKKKAKSILLDYLSRKFSL